MAERECYCPFCDTAADPFGDHARLCACGGDRVKRHNRVRNLLAARAATAGLSPELDAQLRKEKMETTLPSLMNMGQTSPDAFNVTGQTDLEVPDITFYMPTMAGPGCFYLEKDEHDLLAGSTASEIENIRGALDRLTERLKKTEVDH